MNENKDFDDIYSKEEPKSGFDFPKPPIHRDEESCTDHVSDDMNGNDEVTAPAKRVDEYFSTEGSAEEKAEIPKVEAERVQFNPYEEQPKTGFQSSYTPPRREAYSEPTPAYTPPQKKRKTSIVVIVAIIIIGVAVGIGLVVGGLTFNRVSGEPQVSQSSNLLEEKPEVSSPSISTTQSGSVSNVNSVLVAEKVRQSVVGVMTYMNGQLAGEGSGVLWMEKDGYTYILTCAHVIDEKGVDLGVLLLNGKSYEATLVGADTRTDIGVVKIEATGLPLADMGDSSSLKIGEPVYAVGNPGGSEYFGSMTDGIISSIDRSVTSTYKMTCIQHNAAINPGNSGGALVNTAGQIVGINSSKIASTEYEGMGFAVPTSIAKPVAEALVNYGYVPNRPKLGIEYASVSSYQLYSMIVSIKGLPQGSLVIAGISPDSSLAGTKAQVGDLIIGVNGKEMKDSSVLLDLIETGAVGDTLTLTLCRVESRTYKTTEFDVTITLVEDKPGEEKEEETTQSSGGYYYGGASDFEDFFNQYFGW